MQYFNIIRLKSIYILFVSFLLLKPVNAFEVKEFGTPLRLEHESKIAFMSNDHLDHRDLAIDLKRELVNYIGSDKVIKHKYKLAQSFFKELLKYKLRNNQNTLLQTDFIAHASDVRKLREKDLVLYSEKFLKTRAFVDENVQFFLYDDFYFDNLNLDLKKIGYLYRLRYRFENYLDSLMHNIFPEFKAFYPIRCEIQAKWGGYQVENSFYSYESRFEFRKESYPFTLKKYEVPLPPWNKKEYFLITKNGFYNDQVIAPMTYISKVIDPKELIPVINISTQRARFHVHIPNPWGGGPNPSQVFIVTLDKVKLKSLNPEMNESRLHSNFYELEVELDRSTLDLLETVIVQNKQINSLEKVAYKNSLKMRDYLTKDLSSITRVFLEKIKSRENINFIEMKPKYQRAIHD